MFVNWRKKKQIWNASNELMSCEGTTTFQVNYEGQKTEVVALVSSDLDDEVLLGWRAVQRLKIIPEIFPHVMESASTKIAESDKIVQSACVKDTEPDQATTETPSQLLMSSTETSLDPKAKIEKAMADFPSVFEEPSLDGSKLKPMKGGPMTIHMK